MLYGSNTYNYTILKAQVATESFNKNICELARRCRMRPFWSSDPGVHALCGGRVKGIVGGRGQVMFGESRGMCGTCGSMVGQVVSALGDPG